MFTGMAITTFNFCLPGLFIQNYSRLGQVPQRKTSGDCRGGTYTGWMTFQQSPNQQRQSAEGVVFCCKSTCSTEVCALDKRALQSLDFAFNRFFFTKLFKTTNVEVVQTCLEVFHCELSSVQLTKDTRNLLG